jgi:hypothetical protein
MAMCPWHHTYKVTYTLREDVGSGKRIAYVESPNEGMAKFKVVEDNGGPYACTAWRAEQVD